MVISAARAAALGGLCLAVQLFIPFARLTPSRTPPFSPRFSWSMFAGPLTTHCTHAVEWKNSRGESEPFPLPPVSHPAHAILAARTTEEFSRASPAIVAYAESDEDVARALDDLLRRYRRSIDPRGSHSLTSRLACDSPLARPLRRTLRLEGRP